MTDRKKQIEEIYDIIGEFDEGNQWSMATAIYNAGYRKIDEITLKLDLGDRSAEEIQQIAEVFYGEIKKQVAKEIINLVEKSKFDVGNALYLQSIDDDCEVVSVDTLKFVIAENYGVEVEK